MSAPDGVGEGELPRHRPALAAVVVGAAVLMSFALGWWASRGVLPPRQEEVSATPETYTVVETTVGRSLHLNAQASRRTTPVARNRAQGTVTDVRLRSAARVKAGDVLYLVNERPVVVVQGSVPFYRDLTNGTSGRDVAQLNAFLRSVGYRAAPEGSTYTADTARAVRDWQHRLGIPRTGSVTIADVLAAPTLPATMALSPSVKPGATLTGGEEVVNAVSPTADVALVVSEQQAELVPLDGPVNVKINGKTYPAQMGTATRQPSGELRIPLQGKGNTPLCAAECAAAVPVGQSATVGADVVIVPNATGPTVPLRAIRTTTSGGKEVMIGRTTRAVKVLAQANGMAVVEGISVGDVVDLPSDPSSDPSGS